MARMFDAKEGMDMANMQALAMHYIQRLPENKLDSAVDYLRFLCEDEDYPLDDFDYFLAKKADEDESTETITLDALLQKLGISYEELQVGC